MSLQTLDFAATGLSTSVRNIPLTGGTWQLGNVMPDWSAFVSTSENLESVGAAYHALLETTLLELLQAIATLHALAHTRIRRPIWPLDASARYPG